MAFFDDFGRKTLQKTQEIAEITKLNSMISDEERRINQLYYQIGKQYAALHRNDCEDVFYTSVMAIAGAETKIAEYKARVQEIKGVQRCEKCGAEVPRGAAYCNACGAAMPRQPQADLGDYIKCTNCGTAIKKGMRFCTNCGTPVAAASIPVAPPAAAYAPVPKTPEFAPAQNAPAGAADSAHCPACGAAVGAGMSFCTECGTPIPAAAPAPVGMQEISIAVPEPVATPNPVAAPAPVTVPEPAVVSEPVVEPEPVAAPEPVAVSEPVIASASEFVPEQNVPVAAGSVYCPVCGAAARAGMRFCTECGAPIPATPTPAAQEQPAVGSTATQSGWNPCPRCGAMVDAGVRFCTECGAAITAEPEQPVIQQGREKVCPHCGAVLSGDLLFCTECGTRL